MESHTGSTNPRIVLRTATLAREVLERAKTRKMSWPLPSRFRIRRFQEGERDPCFEAAFASVGEHMGRVSERCEKYYSCSSPFQFKECEVAHILRYHSSQAEDLLKAIKAEESKSQNKEQPEDTNTEILTILPVDSAELHETSNQKDPSLFLTTCLPFQAGFSASAPALPASFHNLDPTGLSASAPELQASSHDLVPSPSSVIQVGCSSAADPASGHNQDVFIEVSPGTYSVSASSPADKIKQTHVVKVQPGESVNLTFDL